MSDVTPGELLTVGFTPYNGTFTDGQPANNKLELSYKRLVGHPQLFRRVVSGLCELVEPYQPEFAVGNPDGATGIAGAVSLELDIYLVHLTKSKATREIRFESSIDQHTVDVLKSGVVIEDVLNRRSTTNRVLALPGMSDKINAVVGVFDRGLDDEIVAVDKPVHSLAKMPIPAMLEADSPIWQLNV